MEQLNADVHHCCRSPGARAVGAGSVTLDYYLSDNHGGTEMSGTVDSTRRALRSDPQFEDPANNDYTLKADSPALGDPGTSGLHANDGDRIDLGRYGGTASAGTARGDLDIEDYFYKGQVSGWTKASGTSGSWSGDATQGTYKVTGVSGISRSYASVDGSEYTLETRLKFSGDEGKVLYMQANNNETYRVDLMAANDKVRLSVGQAGLYWPPSVTINVFGGNGDGGQQRHAAGGVRQCAGVLRFHVVGSRRGGDERQVPAARATDQRRGRQWLSALDPAAAHQGVLPRRQ